MKIDFFQNYQNRIFGDKKKTFSQHFNKIQIMFHFQKLLLPQEQNKKRQRRECNVF